MSVSVSQLIFIYKHRISDSKICHKKGDMTKGAREKDGQRAQSLVSPFLCLTVRSFFLEGISEDVLRLLDPGDQSVVVLVEKTVLVFRKLRICHLKSKAIEIFIISLIHMALFDFKIFSVKIDTFPLLGSGVVKIYAMLMCSHLLF